MYECWYFSGTGDPFFGGDADDRILYVNAAGSLRFFRDDWQATREGFARALFRTEREATLRGELLAPAGALISAIHRVERAAA